MPKKKTRRSTSTSTVSQPPERGYGSGHATPNKKKRSQMASHPLTASTLAARFKSHAMSRDATSPANRIISRSVEEHERMSEEKRRAFEAAKRRRLHTEGTSGGVQSMQSVAFAPHDRALISQLLYEIRETNVLLRSAMKIDLYDDALYDDDDDEDLDEDDAPDGRSARDEGAGGTAVVMQDDIHPREPHVVASDSGDDSIEESPKTANIKPKAVGG